MSGYNPYMPPKAEGAQDQPGKATAMVLAPAITLLVLACLGLLLSFVGVAHALMANPGPPDPNAPDFLNQMQQNSVGPFAAIIQAICGLGHGVTIAGSIMQMRMTMRGLAIAGTILAMINIGNCCCLLGLPIGIWNLIVLFNPNVVRGFGGR